MNEQLSSKIQEKINSGEIKCLPRWRFVLFRCLAWMLGVTSIILGSISVSVILFLFDDHRQRGFFNVPHEIAEFLLAIPFVWIVLFIIFIIIARISINHTAGGYKYRFSRVILLTVLASFFLGVIINTIGIGRVVHEFLEEVPGYRYVTHQWYPEVY